MLIVILSIIGLSLSLYALYEHYSDETWCDLGDGWNCSKVLKSPRSEYFGVPNAVLGMLFYASLPFLPLQIQTVAIYIGMLVTLFLAYLLFRYEDQHCIVCYNSYAINTALFITTFL